MNNKLNYIYLLFISFLLVASNVLAQSAKNNQKAGLTYKEQLHIDSLCRLAAEIRFTNPDSALTYGQLALKNAQLYNYEEGEASALESIGGSYWIKSEYIHAFDYCFQALRIRERQGKRQAGAKLLDKIGMMFEAREMYDKAYENFDQALKTYQDIGDDEGIADALSHMGDNLSQRNRHEEGLELLRKALKVREYLGNKKNISRSLNTLGIAYERHGEIEKAINYFKRSLEIKEEQNDIRGIGYNLNYLGNLAVKQKDYNQAIKYYKQSIDYKVSLKDNYGKLFSLLGLAKTYEKKNYSPGIINYGLQAYTLAKTLNSINEIKEVSELLATVYEKREAYKRALFFQKVALEYSNKISNDAYIKELEALRYRYEMDSKDTENELLRKNYQLRQQKLLKKQIELDSKQNTIFIISLILIILILVVFLLFNYSQAKRKKNLAIKKTNEKLERKVAERTLLLQIQNKKLVDYAFFNAHKVRGPLARILGLVTIMKMEFKSKDSQSFTEMMADAANELNEVVAEINHILEEEGLEQE